jgi:hypothetical protein
VFDTAQKHVKKKVVEAAAPKGKIRMGPSASAAWTGVQRLGGGGVKNEAMEETVDADWLQTELNRQEKIATADTEEQMKESRKKN